MIVWIIFLAAVLLPFFIGLYTGYKGTTPMDTRYQPSDNEKEQVALLKNQVDLLDKNRRESWTSPTYFKK